MKKIFFLLFSISFLFSFSQRNCGTMDHLDEIRQNDPTVDQRMQVEESAIQNWIANNPESSMLNVLTIPVVVHVIYKTSSQNISTAQVQSQIDILNEDFRKLNADVSSVPSAFSAVAADVEIEFCLAVRDPNGNTTTGITRTSTTNSSFSGYTSMKYTSSGGHNAWNTSEYLNIWVCNLGSGLLGFATFPGGSSSTDGVVCDYSYFGDIGTATYPYHLGRTATHEVGHWLNLYHIWGDANCGNDYVSDTPTQQSSNYGCPSFPSTSNCSGNGSNGDMFMNYMDYTNDACMYMFSSGQKTRMRAILNGSRSSLLSSNGCVPVNVPIVLSSSITNVSCNANSNGSIDLSVSGGLPPFSYLWSNGYTTQDINNISAATYTVTVTDAQGQTQSGSYAVSEPTIVNTTYSVVNTSGAGMSDGIIYTTTTGGTPPYTYYWLSPSATTTNIYNIPAGNYTFYAIDANGCFSTSVITVQDAVIVPLSTSYLVTDATCNGNSDGAINLTVSGGLYPYTYLWSNGFTSEDLSNIPEGSYNVTITDNSGQTISSSITVLGDAAISISSIIIGESSAGSADGSIDIAVAGGVAPYSYFWNSGQTTEDISGLSAGDYIVYVGYNNWSCFIVDTFTVNIITTIFGCTDSAAINYNSNANSDDGSCCYNNYFKLSMYSNSSIPSWNSGIYWTISDLSGNVIHTAQLDYWCCPDSSNSPQYICLPDACYTISCNGTNGGLGSVSWVLNNINTGNNVAWGGAPYSNQISIGGVSCPIFGCTDPTATNYDPVSTVDDGSCLYSSVCSKPIPIGLYVDDIIQLQAKIHWDNMTTSLCMAKKYYIQLREVGTSSWTNKLAQDAGLCNFGLPTTSKILNGLTPSTTYEYRMKASYCNTTGTSNWTSLHYFTTADDCPNVTNFSATPGPQSQKVVFAWGVTAAYSMVRIKLRVDNIPNPTSSDWVSAGGFGVNYPALTVNKWGLNPGEMYRGQARTWCDPNGGLYRSTNWTPLIWWTQPTSIRTSNPNTDERQLMKITDLLGREVNPERVIDKTILFYIYDNGNVERRIILE